MLISAEFYVTGPGGGHNNQRFPWVIIKLNKDRGFLKT
ncbi:unnamed protein product [Spirodela intermedia]|uniref:Uncharacterized protein n=1 Tax=Spirodela intermedia TaxID=51605 RepID=A0A7I8JEG4_SPIIN|nr:unnamed protein product [Spirodela intermedia]CAA6668499.1 unnamed protein product [Spirodela intermedia]